MDSNIRCAAIFKKSPFYLYRMWKKVLNRGPDRYSNLEQLMNYNKKKSEPFTAGHIYRILNWLVPAQ